MQLLPFLLLLVLFAATGLASAFGWVADSRDHEDWSPTHGGRRIP